MNLADVAHLADDVWDFDDPDEGGAGDFDLELERRRTTRPSRCPRTPTPTR